MLEKKILKKKILYFPSYTQQLFEKNKKLFKKNTNNIISVKGSQGTLGL
jgi:hypothetical protein